MLLRLLVPASKSLVSALTWLDLGPNQTLCTLGPTRVGGSYGISSYFQLHSTPAPYEIGILGTTCGVVYKIPIWQKQLVKLTGGAVPNGA